MDAPNILFSIFFVLLVGGLFYALFKRDKPSEEPNIFAYGGLLIQAHETAKIIVQGIQEAWRTGEIADDEREDDAVEKLVELYPALKEDELRRMVKSAVYLLRKAAGKDIDKIIDEIPEMDHGYSILSQKPRLSPGDVVRQSTEDFLNRDRPSQISEWPNKLPGGI